MESHAFRRSMCVRVGLSISLCVRNLNTDPPVSKSVKDVRAFFSELSVRVTNEMQVQICHVQRREFANICEILITPCSPCSAPSVSLAWYIYHPTRIFQDPSGCGFEICFEASRSTSVGRIWLASVPSRGVHWPGKTLSDFSQLGWRMCPSTWLGREKRTYVW
ncbi:hypothetical protein BJV74DRAFT_829122 [Russula compacta]|nr:hypothetical protein BJV74DRAFT_829122 [Russula compacta]